MPVQQRFQHKHYVARKNLKKKKNDEGKREGEMRQSFFLTVWHSQEINKLLATRKKMLLVRKDGTKNLKNSQKYIYLFVYDVDI